MHSGELARLAGVTVRALRHYHQVGVLAEPERTSNGYRSYDVHDLIRVLRIKRLAAVGVPLDRMPDLLDSDTDASELLDELDAELAAQIERLTRQRELIAHLRAQAAAPDLPPDLTRFLAVFVAAGQSPDLTRMDRDQSVLLAHLAGEDGMPHLIRFYQHVSDPSLTPAVLAISERFHRLGPDSTEQEKSDLIESFYVTFGPGVKEFAAAEAPIDTDGAAVLNDYVTTTLNATQQETLDRITARLATP